MKNKPFGRQKQAEKVGQPLADSGPAVRERLANLCQPSAVGHDSSPAESLPFKDSSGGVRQTEGLMPEDQRNSETGGKGGGKAHQLPGRAEKPLDQEKTPRREGGGPPPGRLPLDKNANNITPIIVYPPDFGVVCDALEGVKRPENQGESYIERFILQAAARVVLGESHRIRNCMRAMVSIADGVRMHYREDIKRASISRVQTCGSVWACPVCSAKITHERREQLGALDKRHFLRVSPGGRGAALLLTRTIPHGVGDALGKLMTFQSDAEMKFRMGKPYKRILKKYGVIGFARSKEITIGFHGFHPHIHDVLFLEYALPPHEVEEMEDELFTLWESACSRAGLVGLSRQAFRLQTGNHASQYIAKAGIDPHMYGLEWELTGQNSKRGRKGSLTPFDLLRVYMQADREKARQAACRLFREYVRETKGKRFITYSKGLLSSYGLKDLEDSEIAESEDPAARILGDIPAHVWRRFLERGKFPDLLAVASSGDWPAVDRYLRGL